MISAMTAVIGIYGRWRKDKMFRQKVVILGSTGMLGSMILAVFAKNRELKIIATYRDHKIGKLLKDQFPMVDFRRIDVEKPNLNNLVDIINGAKWIVNAIGITKPYIRDDNTIEVQKAIYVNSFFPHYLAAAAKKTGSKIIQIATDCVFSGQKGEYVETDNHDALDVYGKTKSLGEVFGENIYHLRCSIIGAELKGHNSLMGWFLRQPKNSKVNGFTNHKWNGVTTLHFARICLGIIIKGTNNLPHIQHIIPVDTVSKAQLLKYLSKEYKRDDISIESKTATTTIDRTLLTNNEKLNKKLWRLAGYSTPPTIQRMIREISQSAIYGSNTK